MHKRFLSIYRPLFCVLAVLCLTWSAAIADNNAQIVDQQHPKDLTHRVQSQTSITECSGCHDCERPTRAEPCLKSCPRYESHFNSQLNPDAGPDLVVIDQLTDLYEPITFAHRLHAEMSEMTGGCENCHHYSEQSGTIPPCRDCHDEKHNPTDLNRPSLKGAYHRQCMNCHMDWSHENACNFCHAQVDQALISAPVDTTDIVGMRHPLIESPPAFTYQTTYKDGPVVTFHHTDHVDMFNLDCVDCHRGDSCSRCHDAQTGQRKSLDHVTTCCSCHGERDCSFCHKQESMPRFNHTATAGWPLAPYHTKAECRTCHGDPKAFRTPAPKCVSCHIHWEVGSFNHAVTGLTLNEDHIDIDCDSCHADMNFKVKPSCVDCHDEPMLPEKLPGKRR